MGNRKYSIEDWRTVRRALAKGASIRRVVELTGIGRGTVFRWSRMDEAPEWMWLNMEPRLEFDLYVTPGQGKGSRLTYEDRTYISSLHGQGYTHQEIADRIGCHRSTVSRELARARNGTYDPRLAQRDAERLARRPKERKLEANARLREYVAKHLELHWSPEQISRKIALDHPFDESMRVSHETIYQALYLQAKGRLKHELEVELALRTKRSGRKPQSRLAPKKKSWVEGAEISLRPAEAADRAVPGHWEGDLVLGSDMKSCLITLVERRSRFVLMSRLTVHDARTVSDRLVEMVQGIPAELAKTLTWDQGSEMAEAARFELATDCKVYFCDPHSPWQRPTNENMNGLIREFFPKGTRFTDVTDASVAYVQWLLNNRPRKVLDWKLPSEVMQEVLAEGAMIA